MSDRPGDPADRATDAKADGAFQGSHRSGYGDTLGRVEGWLRRHPDATLQSGEGWALVQEIDRLREKYHEVRTEWESASERALTSLEDVKTLEAYVVELRDENDRLRAELARCKPIADAAVEYLDAVDNASVAVAWDRKFELERAIDAAQGDA